jgi:ATP-dependent Clp protease ATP-binding subunit ClpX
MFVSHHRTISRGGRCLTAPSLHRGPATCLHRHLSTSRCVAAARRTPDFNSGFTGSYDPTMDSGRGPMFNKSSFGVPQFYPRDLKKRVDDYVVGQDRAKKTICSTIFNHYQNVRRRHQQEHDERNRKEKMMRQRLSRDRELHQRRREANAHPVEGQQQQHRHPADDVAWGRMERSGSRGPLHDNMRRNRADNDNNDEDDYPGHYESLRHLHEADMFEEDPIESFGLMDDPSVPEPVKIDKSNLLLIGPTGVGKTYILE